VIEKLIVLAALTFTVVDGDTIKHDGERIRLWGINAEERHTPAGKEATRALKDITEGNSLVCVARDRDRYGRIVAMCYLDHGKWASVENDIACLMVRAARAKEAPKFSGGYYKRSGCVAYK